MAARTRPPYLTRLARKIRRAPGSRSNVARTAWRALALTVLDRPLGDVQRWEQRFCSQNGEDGVLDAIFRVVGTTNRYYVEFGTENGDQCCTRWLAEARGWHGLLMDGDHDRPEINLHREFITAENINALFARYGVPDAFDLLVIDIDGNDYWVWQRLDARYQPRVVVIEYNASVPPPARRTIAYDPAFTWAGTDYHGASLSALEALGASRGYALVGCDSAGVNAFFVQDSLLGSRLRRLTAAAAYRPAAFDEFDAGHPHDARAMIEV